MYNAFSDRERKAFNELSATSLSVVARGTDSVVYRGTIDDEDMCIRVFRDHVSFPLLQKYASLMDRANTVLNETGFGFVRGSDLRVLVRTHSISPRKVDDVVYCLSPFLLGPTMQDIAEIEPFAQGFSVATRLSYAPLLSLHKQIGLTRTNTKPRWNREESTLTFIATDLAPRISLI